MREYFPSLVPRGLHDEILVRGGRTAESLPYLYPHKTGGTPTSRCSQRLAITLRHEDVWIDVFVFYWPLLLRRLQVVDRSVHRRPRATVPTQPGALDFLILWDLKLSFRGLCEILEVGQVVVADARGRLYLAVSESWVIAESAQLRWFSLHF